MNFSFLNPSILWALPAALIPLLIHLFFRRNPPPVEFGDVRFIRQAWERVKTRLLLRHYLLLIVRTLILLFLVLFFCRPVHNGGAMNGATRNAPPCVVFIIDTSYSMGYTEAGRTRLEQMLSSCRRMIDLLPGQSRIGVIACSDQITASTPGLTNDRRSIAVFLDTIAPSWHTTDLSLAIDAAGKLMESVPAGKRSVVLLSDMAAHGFKGKPGLLPQGCSLIAFEPAEGENRFLHRVSVDYDENEKLWRAEVRGRAGAADAGAPVGLTLFDDGKKSSTGFMSLHHDRSMDCRCLWNNDAASVSGKAVLVPDSLEADNTRYFAGRRPAAFGIWIIDGDPRFGGASAESYYLRTAFPHATVISEAEAAHQEFKVPGLVILANVRQVPASVEQYVAAGGGCLFFAGEHSTENDLPAWLGVSAGTIDAAAQTVAWDAADNSAVEGLGITDFDWQRVNASKTLVLTPLQDSVVLARTSAGWPYFVSSLHGSGRVITCAGTADREWSNLPGKPVFVPLMKSFARYLARPALEERPVDLLVGEPFRTQRVAGAFIRTPSGKMEQPATSGESLSFTATTEPGLYTLLSANRPVCTFAVNLDAASGEGELEPVSRSAVRALCGVAPHYIPAEKWENRFRSLIAGKELTRWMLFLVLLLLAIESWLTHYFGTVKRGKP